MDIRRTPLYAESWNVAYRRRPVGSILNDKNAEFSIIPNSFRYWAADPMVFEHCGKTYIFAELYDYVRRRGVIGYTELGDNGNFSKWKPVIIEDFHMSYPFIFEHGESIYMIPETSAAKELILYRAVDFPSKWERSKTIKKDVSLVDTTLIRRENEFYAISQQNGSDMADYVIRLDDNFNILEFSRRELGDCSENRPGGIMFHHNGSLVKVCQDCKEDYGKALIFKNADTGEYIERITPFCLKLDKSILLCGMHTYSATQSFEVIDIKTRRLNPLNLLCRFIGKLK